MSDVFLNVIVLFTSNTLQNNNRIAFEPISIAANFMILSYVVTLKFNYLIVVASVRILPIASVLFYVCFLPMYWLVRN
jgi:hypothetical protein